MAVSFNSYYLYKKYEKRGDQPWLPVYPETLSIDGDGTMEKVLKTSGDPACYVEPQERWVDTGEYACEVYYDPIYRWVTVVGGYECSGTTKMTQEKEQVSYNSGSTWLDVSPLTTRPVLPVIEYNSEDCGYRKYKLTLNDSSTVTAECDSTSSVTSGEVATQYSGSVVSAEIGQCVTTIGVYAFAYCSSLTSITIPNSVTNILFAAFEECTGLTSIDIPNSVTSIGYLAFGHCKNLTGVTIPNSVTRIYTEAFYKCSNLTNITCLATTPPTLNNFAFDNTNNCPIYVPAASVSTYKSASGWSRYASRIRAIP